jgi:hypothetical protein
MPYVSACNDPTCATTVDGKVLVCPKCGGSMRGIGESPVRGVILLICGLILLGLMGAVTLALWPTLAFPEQAIAAGDFTGTVEQAHMMALLFGVVLLFGILATANGLFMLITGRQSKVFIWLTLGIAVVLILVVAVTMRSIGADKP